MIWVEICRSPIELSLLFVGYFRKSVAPAHLAPCAITFVSPRALGSEGHFGVPQS
jgi:hypothetical protein